MNTSIPHKLTLGRVALHLPQRVDRYQFQQKITATLNRMTLYPSLPPQAILIVRRLPDPAPGEILSQSGRGWEQALQNRLDECWREAVRPAYEPVPPSANAVWFADIAEWLACFSWDLHQGVASGRWWWHWLGKFVDSGVGNTLFRLWQTEAQWLPQTLTLLVKQHGAGGMISLLVHLAPSQATILRQLVVQAYRLPTEISALEINNVCSNLLANDTQAIVKILPQELQSLAILCLAIIHAPTALHQYRQVLAARHIAESAKNTEIEAEKAAEMLLPGTPTFSSNIPPEPQTHLASAITNTVEDVLQFPSIVTDKDTPTEEQKRSLNFPEASPTANESEGDTSTMIVNPYTASPQTPFTLEELLTNAEQGISTALGGLWYLVNVLVDLQWLPNEQPLNPWHQLWGLAQALLPEVPPDPVWAFLMELAEDDVSEVALNRWLISALPEVQTYLANRLECPEAIAQFLTESATLYITRTHIDVCFSLEQIRLDVRLAGLDRDPGWMPELQRAIAFHYE